MKKIIDLPVYGLLPVSEGFFYIKPEEMPDGRVKVEFYGYEARTEKTMPITKWAYLQAKFGPAYKEIASQIKDYVNCEAAVLSNNHTVLLYPDGDFGIFNPKGVGVYSGELKYNDYAIRGIAVEGKSFWGVVPELNAVVCYSTEEKRVQMRIGGGQSTTFSKPSSIVRYNDDLYVCNEGSNLIRSIALSNYKVSNHIEFEEPVKRYFVAGGKEFVVLESGLYDLS